MQKITVAIIFISALLSMQGCTDNEASARKLYNKAMTLQQAGNAESAIVVYKKVVAEYPETETSVEVNKILSSLLASQEAAKKEAEAATKGVMQEIIKTALDMFRLDNGRYPTEKEGLRPLIAAPNGLSNWRGPYISKADADFLTKFGSGYLDKIFDYQGSDDGSEYNLLRID